MTAIAFDLDGCLIDSVGAILPSVRIALADVGLGDLPHDELVGLIGPPLGTGFADLLARHRHDPAGADHLVAVYRDDYQRHMLERTTLYPGIDDVVRAVVAVRPCCVVTSKPQALATPILEHLGLLDAFVFVEGPSMGAEHEPKAETLGRALERLPSIAWMVGDRHHDIDAARAHGIGAMGVRWGFGSAEELAAADRVVATPDELREALA